MATVKCSVCEQGASIAFCAESGVPLCSNCVVTCQVCYTPVSRERIHLTSTGRKLCTKCMAERNARRKMQKQKRKRDETGAKETSEPTPAVVSGPTGGTSFSALAGEGSGAGTSFENLSAGEAEPLSPLDTGFGSLDDDPRDKDDEEKVYGPEGIAMEGKGRLELGPVDKNRPILMSSGYQAPSVWKYAIAFLFFGLGGIAFLSVSEEFQDLMWPYETPPLQFASDRLAPVGSTNALRDTSNVSQLDIFAQGPIFLIAWSIVLAYVIGSILIFISVIRSAISSILSKRRLKKAQEQATDEGYSFPG